jgi:hypothetical protein
MTKALSFEEAEKVGLVAQEGCMGGCQKEARKLYRLTDGIYAGSIYCKGCMMKHLKALQASGNYEKYRKMLEKGEMI